MSEQGERKAWAMFGGQPWIPAERCGKCWGMPGDRPAIMPARPRIGPPWMLVCGACSEARGYFAAIAAQRCAGCQRWIPSGESCVACAADPEGGAFFAEIDAIGRREGLSDEAQRREVWQAGWDSAVSAGAAPVDRGRARIREVFAFAAGVFVGVAVTMLLAMLAR